jgi:hypothetical protein
MREWEPSRSDRFEEKFGIRPKSLLILFGMVGAIACMIYLLFFQRFISAESDIRGTPSLTKIATISRIDPNPPFNIVTVNFGKGAESQTESSLDCHVGEKVIATYQVGKSGRYYIVRLQPIPKPKRKVMLP